MLDGIAQLVQQQLGDLMLATMAAQSGMHVFNFHGNAVVAAVDEAIADAMPGGHAASNQFYH